MTKKGEKRYDISENKLKEAPKMHLKETTRQSTNNNKDTNSNKDKSVNAATAESSTKTVVDNATKTGGVEVIKVNRLRSDSQEEEQLKEVTNQAKSQFKAARIDNDESSDVSAFLIIILNQRIWIIQIYEKGGVWYLFFLPRKSTRSLFCNCQNIWILR